MSTEITRPPRRVGTGSSIERLIRCPSSIALPHAYTESDAADRGIAIHAFLEHLSTMSRDEALALVPEEWLETCDAIDITGIDLQLSLAAEVSLAYDCETDTARELGRGEVSYRDVRDSEIPVRLDAIGIRDVPAGKRGLVCDHKTGWAQRKKIIDDDWQLKICALAAARCYGLDIVEVQLIHVGTTKPWVKRATYTAFQIDRIAAEVREHYARALEVRALYERGEIPQKFNLGAWCDYCPSRAFCPAQVNALRALVRGDETADLLRLKPATAADVAYLRNRLDSIKRDVSALEKMAYGAAASLLNAGGEPIVLGTLPDGRKRVLMRVIGWGNEQMQGDVAFDVLSEMFGEEVAVEGTTIEASKKSVEAAIKAAVPKGSGKKAIDRAYEEMRKRSGFARKSTDKIEEEIVKDANPPPMPQLPRPVIDIGCDQGPYPMDGPPGPYPADDVTAPMPTDEEGPIDDYRPEGA